MGAIGVFDSGYGGLTVLKAIREKLPQYDYIYYGDNLRAPYGTRSFEEVYEFTLMAVQKLFSKGCPMVILACNTASAKALRTIQQRYLPVHEPGKRVLGVIRPSAEILGELSETNHIGLLATEGTVKSDSYKIELEKFSPDTQLFQLACPRWVPLIEAGEVDTVAGRAQIEMDVQQLLTMSPQIDTILLACTHYPIIAPIIQQYLPTTIQLVSQGEIVANSLENYLERHPEIEESLEKNGTISYFTSGSSEQFDLQAEKIMHMQTNAQVLK